MAATLDPRLTAELMLKEPGAYARLGRQVFLMEFQKKIVVRRLQAWDRRHERLLNDLDKSKR